MTSVNSRVGGVVWRDLTVSDAEGIRDFYQKVTGWTSAPVEVADYHDYNMISPATSETISGICHARETIKDYPPKWLIYITVADLDASVKQVESLGGKVFKYHPEYGFAVIQDPAGAFFSLMQDSGKPDEGDVPSTDSDAPKQVGEIVSIDLTIPDTEAVRDFYSKLIGWTSFGLDMGGYEDYVMMQPNGEPVAGVCHKRGVNADLPSYWLSYIAVADLEASLKTVTELGGKVLTDIREGGGSHYAIIEDPAGAYAGILAYD